MENSFQTKEVFLLMSVGIAVMLLLALAFVLFFYFSQKKFQAQRLREQEIQLQHQEQLLYSTIQAQEKERERIAKELHDSIGSKLNVINLGLHRLGKLGKDIPEIGKTTQDIFQVISNTIASTRRISHDLLPPTLENFGLKEALVELCEGYRQTAGLALSFELMQNERQFSDKLLELNLFRTVQELISNSIKHGNAKHISLKLWLSHLGIKLEYMDDGKGFDMEDTSHKNGLGMRNIESRMRMINSIYSFESAPGKGVKFKAIYNYPAL